MPEYFPHDYDARGDEKIRRLLFKHGMIGYGVFWSLVEDLYMNANALQLDCERIAYDMRVDSTLVHSVLHDFSLFHIEDGIFSSNSVAKRLEIREDKSEKGRKAANARWNKNADALQTHCTTDADAMPKRKEKEIKEKEKESKEKERESSTTANVHFDWQELVKTHAVNWEQFCMTTGKPLAVIQEAANDYQLSLAEKNQLPVTYQQFTAGLQRRINNGWHPAARNEKQNNGNGKATRSEEYAEAFKRFTGR